MQLEYITPNDEMQIVQERWDGSVEVYNFKSIYSQSFLSHKKPKRC